MTGEKQTFTSPEQPSDSEERGLRDHLRAGKLGRVAAWATEKNESRKSKKKSKREFKRQRNVRATAEITARYQQQVATTKARLEAEHAADEERTARPTTPEGMQAFDELLDRFGKYENSEWTYPGLDTPEAKEALWAVRTGSLDPILAAEQLRKMISRQITDGVVDEDALEKLITTEDEIHEPAGVPEHVLRLVDNDVPTPQKLLSQAEQTHADLATRLAELHRQMDEISRQIERTINPSDEADLRKELGKLQQDYETALAEQVRTQDTMWTNAREGRQPPTTT